MSVGFERDLAHLRGFGNEWNSDAAVATPEAVSPLERLLADAEPPTAAEESEFMRRLVHGEAVLFVSVVQSVGGAAAWASWCESDEAQARQTKPPEDIRRLSGLHLDAPALLVEVLDQVGVLRIHRAMFLRCIRRRYSALADRFEDEFDEMAQLRESLVLRNLKLALWAVRIPAFGTMENLLYGSIGLVDAIDRFEVDRGRVSTYATSWILARKSRASAYFVGALRDPGYMTDQRMKVRNAVAAIRERGDEPTTLDILPALEGIEQRRVLDVYRKRPLGERLATEGVGGASRLMDLRSEEPLLDVMRAEQLGKTWSLVQQAIESLPERKRGIVVARLGLIDGRSRTLSDIGRDLELSRERIRQLQNAAFETIVKYVSEHGGEGAAGSRARNQQEPGTT